MINTILSIPTYSEPSNVLIIMNWIFIILLGLFLLSAIVAIVWSIFDGELSDVFGGAIISIIVSSAAIFFMSLILHSQYEDKAKYPEWYESEIEEVQYDHIYSLKLNNEVSGYFFLGSGKVGTDTYYYFYIKNSYDAYQLTKIKADGSVYLKESDDTPKIVERKDAKSTKIYTLIYVPVGTVVDYGYSPL